MSEKLVNIRLHSILGEAIGEEWNLAIKSVSEAIRAIEILSEHKLYKFLYQNDKNGIRYQVLINKRLFIPEEELIIDNIETIRNCELVLNSDNLESVDIIPILEGAGGSDSKGILGIVLGAILVVVGIFVPFLQPIAAGLIIGGIGLIAAGIINLLSSPPRFEDFREIDGRIGRTSYLFNGPQNTTREGGPVPVGYGRLIVGSQVVSAAYEIKYIDAGSKGVPQAGFEIGNKTWFYVVDPAGNKVYNDPWGRGDFIETVSTQAGQGLGFLTERIYKESDDGSDDYFTLTIPYGDRAYSNIAHNNNPPYIIQKKSIGNSFYPTFYLKDRKTQYYYTSIVGAPNQEPTWERVIVDSQPLVILKKSRI